MDAEGLQRLTEVTCSEMIVNLTRQSCSITGPGVVRRRDFIRVKGLTLDCRGFAFETNGARRVALLKCIKHRASFNIIN